MATIASKILIKTNVDTFPITENVVIPSALFVRINNQGVNAIDYLFVTSTDKGRIKRGTIVDFNSTSDAIDDTIEVTFYAPATVTISWTDGVPTGGTGGGDATAANQVIVQNYLNGTTPSTLSGQEDTPLVIEDIVPGTRATLKALAYSVKFYGTGGELNGVAVESGYIADFGTNDRNEVKGILYTVPTAADFQGFQRVVITYINK